MSDTSQPSASLLNLLLAVPEAGVRFLMSLVELPGVVVKRGMKILFGVGKKNGKVEVSNGKGKTVKGTKSPNKKRTA